MLGIAPGEEAIGNVWCRCGIEKVCCMEVDGSRKQDVLSCCFSGRGEVELGITSINLLKAMDL